MKMVFFDRDGTLIEDQNYQNRKENFKWLPKAVDGLRKLKNEYSFCLVTNQSGVAKKISTAEELETFSEYFLDQCQKEGIPFLKVFACPHSQEDNCECRKPKIQFAKEAIQEFKLNPVECWMMGDKTVDVEWGVRSAMRSILLLTGDGRSQIEKAKKIPYTYCATDVSQAADFILAEKNLNKIYERKEIGSTAAEKQAQKKSIVTLNGTFDLLHEGHEKILKEAKSQGDFLIVALNTDESVRKNKGPERPINRLEARMRMMASFPFVDAVTSFSEPTPIELLEEIKPNVHVNGSEYGSECIEAPTVKKYGGRIHIVHLVPGISSSKILSGSK